MKKGTILLSPPSARRLRLIRIVIEIIVAMLVILWIYTGLNKAFDYDDFKFQLGRSPFLQNISGFIAATLPAGEVLIAIILVFPRTRMFGLLLSFFLMLMFSGYIYAMLHFSYYIPCSCGGVLGALSWENHLIFNIFYTLLALTGLILQSKLNNWFRTD